MATFTYSKELLRLKWPLFQTLSLVNVLDLDAGDSPGYTWTPLFGDGNDHPVASRPATQPHCKCLRVYLDPVDAWDHWGDTGMDKPAALVIEASEDEKFVNIGKFVRAAHDYFSSLEALLLEAMGEDPDEPDELDGGTYYFAGCLGPLPDEGGSTVPVFSVYLVNTEMDNMEAWWQKIIADARDRQSREEH